MMKLILLIAVVLSISGLGCSSPTVMDDSTHTRKKPPEPEQAISGATLPFLADVPEFHNIELTIAEDELASLIREKSLLVTITKEDRGKTYHIYRKDGENVIVMFREGKCSGIQRMMRDPLGVPNPQ